MRMVNALLAGLFVLGCAATKGGDDNPAPTHEAAKQPPATPAPNAAPPAADPAPEPQPCGDTTCTPPEECLTVVGSLENAPVSKECWIPCESDADCPKGMLCSMIHDGPGQVCVKAEPLERGAPP